MPKIYEASVWGKAQSKLVRQYTQSDSQSASLYGESLNP